MVSEYHGTREAVRLWAHLGIFDQDRLYPERYPSGKCSGKRVFFFQLKKVVCIQLRLSLAYAASMEEQAPAGPPPSWGVLLQPHLDLQQLTHLHGKRVLLRADLNLPLTTSGAVADATRIDSILPTLETLTAKGARVVLCSHLGRPDTSSAADPKAFSLAPVAALLAARLPSGAFTGLVPDCVGQVAADAVAALKPGQVCGLLGFAIETGCSAGG